MLIQQESFHKEQDMNSVLNLSVLELSENPNRPMGIGKYYEENNSPKQKSIDKVFHDPLSYSRIIKESSTRTTKEATEEFGQLWLQYPMEHKLKFECSVVECEKLARRLRKSWRIEIIQLIGQEFIATTTTTTNSDVLIHVALLAHQQFELTLKAKQFKDISDFLIKRQLV
ncbi:uncharacterized protein B0P05DRAFT_38056 [Gilbertella persicaria]|uniref:uncharacterized protein n=1 Tax=Gilbertella persicaria TaxID=101096 RepID=UPI00221F459E|nr:uncharacterized protein B0P05DRAFT_38056 [Gilbertella persicaria]KAI8084416.1 hypothetical protein B0P05DRAFT_38056 [Gilbertella persicaria]